MHLSQVLGSTKARIIAIVVFIVAGMLIGFGVPVIGRLITPKAMTTPVSHVSHPPAIFCRTESHVKDIMANCPSITGVRRIVLSFSGGGVPFQSFEDTIPCTKEGFKGSGIGGSGVTLSLLYCDNKRTSFKYIVVLLAAHSGVWVSNVPTFRVDFIFPLPSFFVRSATIPQFYTEFSVTDLRIGAILTTLVNEDRDLVGLEYYQGKWFYVDYLVGDIHYWRISSASTGVKDDASTGQRFQVSGGYDTQTVKYQGYNLKLSLNPDLIDQKAALLDIQ